MSDVKINQLKMIHTVQVLISAFIVSEQHSRANNALIECGRAQVEKSKSKKLNFVL